jgi:hypothetical protein
MGDAQNWRDHVQAGEYWKIALLYDLPMEELLELREILHKIVPKKIYGDGLETYSDYIVSIHASNENDFQSSRLLRIVQQHIDSRNTFNILKNDKPFEKPVLCAIEVLKSHGITYNGLYDTFIFWSDRRRKWVQIDAHLRRKIFNKGQRELGYRFHYERGSIFDDENNHLPDESETSAAPDQIQKESEWWRRYPWRGGSSCIFYRERQRHIEPFTEFWHALNILIVYEDFKRTFASLVGARRHKQKSRTHLAVNGLSIAESGRKIGESYDALRTKLSEYETLAYRTEKHSRSIASGKKSSKKKSERIKLFMEEIEKLGDMFPRMNEQKIVDQAFDNVINTYPDLWNQGKGQKEAYLSQHIRSEEPFKSRYYAIFGKTA